MNFIEENIEEGIDLKKVIYKRKGESFYADGRRVIVRACHDAFVSYKNKKGEDGIILVTRKSDPAKGLFWCFGGGIEKGVPVLTSLEKNIKKESGLGIRNATLINTERCIWKKHPSQLLNPNNLPYGVDDLILVYYCEGIGRLKLNNFHENPLIITEKKYFSFFKKGLHPYIQRGMELSFNLMKNT